MMEEAFPKKCCPCCGVQGQLHAGPRGGCAVNVLCAWCGTRYNVALFRDVVANVEVVTPGPRHVPAEEQEFFKEPI